MKNKNFVTKKTLALLILDGWGIGNDYEGNALTKAKPDFFLSLINKYPACLLKASGMAIGLSKEKPGNSDAGHRTLGLGRVINQNKIRLDKAIKSGRFFTNDILLRATDEAKNKNGKIHLIGLISDAENNSSMEHLEALLKFLKEQKSNNVFLHLILDGLDAPKMSGVGFLQEVKDMLKKHQVGEIASLHGSFFALDNNFYWERTAKSYKALLFGEGRSCQEDVVDFIKKSYQKKIYEAEFLPTVIYKNDNPVALINNNDSVIMFNFEAGRILQLAQALFLPGFNKFDSYKYLSEIFPVTLVNYDKYLPVKVAFPKRNSKNSLYEIIKKNEFKQLYVAEANRFAQIRDYFCGHKQWPMFDNEFFLVPGKNINSTKNIGDLAIKAIKNQDFNFMVLNFSEADLWAHDGNFEKTVKAIKVIDKKIKKIVNEIVDREGVVVICSSHGCVENLLDMKTEKINKKNSDNPVPFILVGADYEGKTFGFPEVPGGDLSLSQIYGDLTQVAPTILKIFNLKKPPEMTGESLI